MARYFLLRKKEVNYEYDYDYEYRKMKIRKVKEEKGLRASFDLAVK